MKPNATHNTSSIKKAHGYGEALLLLTHLLLLLSSMLLVTSCNLVDDPSLRSAVTPTPAETEAPILKPHRAHLLVEARVDISSSYYPSSAFTQATKTIADAIDGLVQLNSDGATVYVGLISENSYQSASTMMVITIPSLSADPLKPIAPKITKTDDPYQNAQAAKQAQDDYALALATWQATLQQNHRQLAAAKRAVRKQTDKLRALQVPVDNIATDLAGALEAASEHFQGEPGEKYLLLATDLVQNTHTQDTGDIHLSGVRVRILDRVCTDATFCEQNDAYWRNRLLAAGATAVSITDPAQSQAIENLFS